MTALRWTRRTLDILLLLAIAAVIVTAGITLLAPVLGGRAMVIGGGSMEPSIGRGALVLALPGAPASYAVGDVVTVQQGGATPYTHRITRLTDLEGVPYVETKGDANPRPDPAIVPIAAIVGRVVIGVPLLGFLSLVLGTAAGLAGFLAVSAMALLLIWVLEDLEEGSCPACAAAAAAARLERPPAEDPAALGILGALPAFAAPVARTRVRETGRARDPSTPVILEVDRLDPLRRGSETAPGRVPAAAATVDPGAGGIAA